MNYARHKSWQSLSVGLFTRLPNGQCLGYRFGSSAAERSAELHLIGSYLVGNGTEQGPRGYTNAGRIERASNARNGCE